MQWGKLAKGVGGALSFINPLLGGALAAGGTILQNRANAKQVQQQMDFQERMSSTAAQRSARDFAAAGLNPALAYDHTASSPGGASATLGNAVESGMSSAMQIRQANQGLKIAKSQNEADLKLKRAQENQATAGASLNAAAAAKTIQDNRIGAVNEQLLNQQLKFQAINQPWDLRMRAAETLLTEAGVTGAQASAQWDKDLGKLGPIGRTLGEIIKTLKPSQFRK